MVIFNNVGDDLFVMGAAPVSGDFPLGVTIPAVLIGQSFGDALADLRENGQTVNVTLTEAQWSNTVP